MELFERMAYYGMYSVLALYLTGNVGEGGLGFSPKATGTMMGVYTFFLYLFPIFGGALADRYGYKKALCFAFALLSAGYLLTGHFRSYPAVFASLLLVSIGGATFKPVISGTISRTTDETTGSVGFGIFYMVVNIGGFLGPFVASRARTVDWRLVFIASAIWILLMYIPALFIFREPTTEADRENPRSLKKVLTDAVLVLTDLRFILFLVIMGGYWTIYYQLFMAMPLYIRDSVNTIPALAFLQKSASALGLSEIAGILGLRLARGAGIPPELLINIDAGTIIVLQLFISRIVTRFRPISTMIAGILLGSLGWAMASSSVSVWMVMASIVVFSIGEMTASPKMLEYVGRIAPADKVALFMGYAFLPMAIGNIMGGTLGGIIYESLARDINRPDLMWGIFAAMGLLTALALAAYNHFLVREKAVTDLAAES